MGPKQWCDHAAAARPGWSRPGACLGAPGALSAALRAGKHAGLPTDDAGAILSFAAQTGDGKQSQASRRNDTKILAASP